MNATEHVEAARSALLAEIESFLTERGMSAKAFGQLAVNDGKFVARLRSGENMTTDTITRVHRLLGEVRRAVTPEAAD